MKDCMEMLPRRAKTITPADQKRKRHDRIPEILDAGKLTVIYSKNGTGISQAEQRIWQFI